jgi:hypothetical protein
MAEAKQSRLLREALMPGETVLHEAKFHWFYTVSSFIILALWMGFGASVSQLIHYVAVNVFGHNSALNGTGAGAALERIHNIPVFTGTMIGLFFLTYRLLNKLTTEIYVTNKRFIFKRGVFTVQVAKMALKEVNYASVKQSWLGNLLGYGGLDIFTFTQDDKNISMPNIDSPNAFTKALEMAKEGAGMKNNAPTQASVSA